MKILLVQLFDENQPVFPLGLSYLASSLSGHVVETLDQNVCAGDPFAETGRRVREFSPDVVGVSLRNLCFLSAREKRWRYYPEQLGPTLDAVLSAGKPTVVVGGAGFSLFPKEILRNEPRIDFGVFLEGEESFRNLLGSLGDPDKIGGICLRKDGVPVLTVEHARPDFASLPAPRRDFFDLKNYGSPYAVGIQAKRGCILSCTYCSYPAISGNFLRMRAAADVVDEIEQLHRAHGVQEFSFVDNVFNIPITHAEEICREIVRRGLRLRWTAWFNERFITDEFVDLAMAAGCRTFEFSPDGYSNRSLKWLKKNIETRHIVAAYKVLKRKPGIEIKYHFMVGIPGQDIVSLIRLALFSLRLKIFLGRRLKRLHFNPLYIIPNTEAYEKAIRDRVIRRDQDLMMTLTRYESGVLSWASRVLRFVKRRLRRSR